MRFGLFTSLIFLAVSITASGQSGPIQVGEEL